MTTPAPGAGLSVVALHVYPVKSLAGVAPESAPVDARGLRGDRRWAVVDPSGAKVTAREVKELLGLTATPSGADGMAVTLTDRHGGRLEVEPPRDGARVAVDHRGQGTAAVAGAAADEWLSARAGRPIRLVWQEDRDERPVRADHGGRDGDVNSLSDAAPLLLTTDASLARLNSWIEESGDGPVGHDRFRPNVVVDGDVPFAEDGWETVTIGEVAFRVLGPCDRCVMTLVDRDSLRTGKEPIRTLARHRKWDGSTWFGVRLAPVAPLAAGARLQVGDRAVAT